MSGFLDNLLAGLKSEHEAEYIDRSDLEAFAQCPQQGHLRKEHPESGETHDALPVTGKIVHAIAEEAITVNEFSLQDAADHIAEELPKALGRVDDEIHADVQRAGKYLARELRERNVYQIIMCEEQITRTLIPASKHRGELLITTKPDLVLATTKAGSILVLDYKSGWKQRTNAEAADAMQTHVIAWCLLAKYPDVETIHFWYIETRKGTRAYAKIVRDDEMILQARIMEAARIYQEGIRDAWPSETKCAWCPVIQWCEYAEEVCGELEADPKKYVDNTIVLDEVLKRRNKAISEATKNGRALYGSSGRYDDTPKKKSVRRVSFKEEKAKATKKGKSKKKTQDDD